jgi:hypothetical protein
MAKRYSQAFKMQVVRELETGGINIDQIRLKVWAKLPLQDFETQPEKLC